MARDNVGCVTCPPHRENLLCPHARPLLVHRPKLKAVAAPDLREPVGQALPNHVDQHGRRLLRDIDAARTESLAELLGGTEADQVDD